MKYIYLDNQSNTKLDKNVFDVMVPFFVDYYGNPQSIYSLGSISKDALDDARSKVASFINADINEIIFTSCATESNNLLVKGIAESLKNKGKHIIVSAIEHFSILNPLKRLQNDGFEVTYLSVDAKGNVNAQELKKSLRKDTILVSIQHSNPEVGTIQNIKDLVAIVKNNKINDFVVFHTDAVSSCGFMPIDVKDLNVDALTFSSSVMYGPKGAAALYVKKEVKIVPQIEGGVQENSKRSGTENIPAIVGFGKACQIAKEKLVSNVQKIKGLRDKLINELPKKIEYIYLNGAIGNRLPNNVNFSIEFVEGEALFLLLDAIGIMAASGSACANKNLKISHVLSAMKVDVAVGQGSIVFTLSKYNTQEDIDYVLEEFPKIVSRLREMSPLYSYFLQTGKRKKAGPGTDFDHEHDHCHINEE
ncbi:MAG: cysteine desulfurase [Endomicrobium sp.]|jgi:cysteine desulfurase|uniref:cysteine desulfurase family protein n=1 Tax=Candidatus Endomicrobiellum cubanum TaxID=3242325 RepID=UPI0028252607|nr:cysteine desulfurase [Endomicrobium sp.]